MVKPRRKTTGARRSAAAGKNIGAEMIQGMKEAIAFERGKDVGATFKAAPISARQATVTPAPDFSPKEIAALRESLRISQSVFARALNVSPETEKAWEQGKAPPNGASKRLLQIVKTHPAILESFVQIVGNDSGASTSRRSGPTRITVKGGDRL